MSWCFLLSFRGSIRLLEPDLCLSLKDLRMQQSMFAVNCKQRVEYVFIGEFFSIFDNMLWVENTKSLLWQRTFTIPFIEQKHGQSLKSEFYLLDSISPPSVQSSASTIMRFFSPLDVQFGFHPCGRVHLLYHIASSPSNPSNEKMLNPPCLCAHGVVWFLCVCVSFDLRQLYL